MSENTPKLQLPVVIVSGIADANEVAEKIVRDNPQWFGELPEDIYKAAPDQELEKALRQRDEYKAYWRTRALAAERGRGKLVALVSTGSSAATMAAYLLAKGFIEGWF